MPSSRTVAVILAAGAGTRMRSTLPKPLHPVAGEPMLGHVLRTVRSAGVDEIVVVASPTIQGDAAWRDYTADVTVAVQDEPHGTGHAVMAAFPHIDAAETVVVAFADHPLLNAESLTALLLARAASDVRCAVLTCVLDDAAGYGRIARDDRGRVVGVVERNDDDPALRMGPTEVNSGMMALDASWLREELPTVGPSPATGEIYLTELIAAAASAGTGEPWPVIAVQGSSDELIGINDRVDLAEVDARLRRRIRETHMRSGVTMIGAESILIDADVTIGPDTTLYPGTLLLRGSSIGTGCRIGPDAVVERSRIGDGCTVRSSYVVDSEMADGSDVGPFSHLRGGSSLGEGVHVGTSAELKRTRLGAHVQVGHFSYLGDATIGARTNIGAGTVTVNYDGVGKHETHIGEAAFIGSDSMLIAPIAIGDHSTTGAGSVVTKDVQPGVTVVGVPARPIRRRQAGEPGA